MPGNWLVRFGKRSNETDRRKPTRRVAPTAPCLCSGRADRGLDGDQHAEGDQSAPLAAAAQPRMARPEIFLRREDPTQLDAWGGLAGEESLRTAIAGR